MFHQIWCILFVHIRVLCLGFKAYCYHKGLKLSGRTVLIKTMCENSVPSRIPKNFAFFLKLLTLEGTLSENAWWVRCIPHIPPGSTPVCMDNNVSYHYTNWSTSRFGFSFLLLSPASLLSYYYTNQAIWLQHNVRQILSQLFWNNSTYCTGTVWTLRFKNKGLVLKGGSFNPHPLGSPNNPSDQIFGRLALLRQRL